MKKFLTAVLIGALSVSLFGCGSSSSDKNDSESQSTEEVKAFSYTNETPMKLWENVEDMPYYDKNVSGQAVTLTPYVTNEKEQSGCLIICPGGGYTHLATDKEGTQPALALNENGISAFVLEYRVAPYDYRAILSDVLRAVRFVRYHAKDFGIDPNKIGVMGYSAGGHLAAMALEHYEDEIKAVDDIDKVSAKPDCGVLGYPVLSMLDDYTHKGSRENFLGNYAEDEEMRKQYSAELGVTADTPPCFIWHCDTDTTVPYAGSQAFADAMAAAGAKCEFHLYHWGGHGIGLASDNKAEVKDWFPSCVEWLRGLGF